MSANSSNNGSITFSVYDYTLEDVLSAHGSTLWTDLLWLCPLVAVNSFGLSFNLFSFLVLHDFSFGAPLYQYLRVYTLNSSIINLALLLERLTNSFHGSPQTIHAFVLEPVFIACAFVAACLDVAIAVDRLSYFSPRVRASLQLYPHQISLVCVMSCTLVLLACLFVHAPYPHEFGQRGNLTVMWLTEPSESARTDLGHLTNLVLYSLRNVLVVVIEIGLNLVLVVHLREYVEKRNEKSALKKEKFLVASIDNSNSWITSFRRN
jgi:hypothetical protein